MTARSSAPIGLKDAAAYLGMNPQRLRTLCKAGQGPKFTGGGFHKRSYFTREDLDAWLETRTDPQTDKHSNPKTVCEAHSKPREGTLHTARNPIPEALRGISSHPHPTPKPPLPVERKPTPSDDGTVDIRLNGRSVILAGLDGARLNIHQLSGREAEALTGLIPLLHDALTLYTTKHKETNETTQ